MIGHSRQGKARHSIGPLHRATDWLTVVPVTHPLGAARVYTTCTDWKHTISQSYSNTFKSLGKYILHNLFTADKIKPAFLHIFYKWHFKPLFTWRELVWKMLNIICVFSVIKLHTFNRKAYFSLNWLK